VSHSAAIAALIAKAKLAGRWVERTKIPPAWALGSGGSVAIIAWLVLPPDFPSMIEMTGPR